MLRCLGRRVLSVWPEPKPCGWEGPARETLQTVLYPGCMIEPVDTEERCPVCGSLDLETIEENHYDQ